MPPIAKYVFVGGALTELARYLINHKIECLVMNGGFAGSNIVKNPLDKFIKYDSSSNIPSIINPSLQASISCCLFPGFE